MRARDTWATWAWSVLLAVGMLGPALGPGFVLSYDMVWVPDLTLSRDALGLGAALPRAVPSDLVVAISDELLPGAWLQKVVLLGALASAGAGAAALVPELPLAARLVAATVAVWNPFVVERLTIGHWPVLLGCAVLPWLLLAMRRWSSDARIPRRVGPLLVVGSLSASAGLGTAVVAFVTAPRGRRLHVAGLLGAANAPWIVSGLLHRATAYSDPASASVFATSGEGLLPAPLAALTLGGIWNAEVVPDSRTTWVAVLGLAALAALVVIGVRGRDAAVAAVPLRPLVICWAVGYGLATLSALLPGVVAWMVTTVPGGGLVRDGSRLLGLCVPVIAVLVAYGAGSLAARARDRVTHVAVAAALVLVPISVLPDASWGHSGRLQAVEYPAGLLAVEDLLTRLPQGDVVVLPFASFRAPEWNDGRTVLDPLPRLAGRGTIVNDELSVDGVLLSGEDPRAAEVRSALGAEGPTARAEALGALGVVGTITDLTVRAGAVPDIAGATVGESDAVRVDRIAGATAEPARAPVGWWVAMGFAWSGFGACLAGLPTYAWARGRRRSARRV